MIEIIQQRLGSYKTGNPVEEGQAAKEILQEIALYSLWRAGFFEVAAFQGGTSLRILHKLPRFSEDLDFILKEPDPGFEWSGYLQKAPGRPRRVWPSNRDRCTLASQNDQEKRVLKKL